ncbi:hypothetical protein LB504_008430 [Fusarium proliferatum]|nr:hypothetical protein LB504_008430 [Fusarium proliferatum]
MALQEKLEVQSSSAKQLMNWDQEERQKKLTKAEKELTTFQSEQKRVGGLTPGLGGKAHGRLATFHSFVVKLDNFEVRRSEVIFRNALSVVESSIGIALDKACLTGIRTILLLASNSLAAKQIRVTAGLRIYSMALADHVFRSTYLTQNSDFGRNKVLRTLT